MLSNLLLAKMRERGLSARALSREVGIAHTTINRILAGKGADLSTLELLSKYLGVELSTIIGTTEGELAKQISLLLEAEPALAGVFAKAIQGVLNGTYSNKDVEDIVAYAAFRLNRGVDEIRSERVTHGDRSSN